MAKQWCSNQIKAMRRRSEAVGGTPTAAGGTPALPDAWGLPLKASHGRLKQIQANQIRSSRVKLKMGFSGGLPLPVLRTAPMRRGEFHENPCYACASPESWPMRLTTLACLWMG